MKRLEKELMKELDKFNNNDFELKNIVRLHGKYKIYHHGISGRMNKDITYNYDNFDNIRQNMNSVMEYIGLHRYGNKDIIIDETKKYISSLYEEC